MSPLEAAPAASSAGPSPDDSPSVAAPSRATTPSSSANANGASTNAIESLGDALAGVNLGFHTSTPTGGTHPGTSSTADAAGWGGFSNPEASRNIFARNGSTAAPGSSANDVRDDHGASATSTAQPSPHHPHADPSTTDPLERKQSLDLFLSRSPSQVLGKDVFKLSTGNLPGLAIPEESAAAAPTPAGGATAPSPTASTTTASRSNSPYESGGAAAAAVATGGHTIQAFQTYDQQAKMQEGVNGAAPAYHPVTPSSAAAPVPSYQDPGSANSNSVATTPRLQSPYGGAAGVSAGTSLGFAPNASPAVAQQQPPTMPGTDAAAQQQQQQQQPQQQILYMAVPTPDGRGQVLQPVQIMQMPGKQFAYVLPGPDGMQAAMPAMQGGAQQVMVMPNMMPQQQGVGGGQMASPMLQQPQGGMMQGQGNDVMNGLMGGGGGAASLGRNSNQGQNKSMGGYGGSANDNYSNPNVGSLQGQNGMGNDASSQYLNQPTDPALASLYATPQRPPLDALLGQIRRLSRDQVGCRLVQQALDEEGPMAATLILNEGLPFWGEAMVDPFGNYLFQKILEKITVEERVMLIKSVSTRLVNASLNLHGTRSVQKIVELCAIDEENLKKGSTGDNIRDTEEDTAADVLTNALAPAAARLCIDSHGNHVIQRILLKLGHKHAKFIFDAVAESVGDVARHRHGCCVIQRCLDSPQGPSRANLVHRIVDKSLELMQDAYGNYVVQYVLDVCSDNDVHAVCESVVGKVNLLAIQKFSSNVMEKCLERCTDRVKEAYMTELSDTERVRELMMDPFGNYVVQRALSVATHAQAVRLVESMRPHLIAQAPGTPTGQRNGGVRNTAGGRRIMAKICRRFPNFNLNGTGSSEELYSQNRRHHHHHNPTATLGPMYGMTQLAPSPVQILQQQPMQQHMQQQPHLYAANMSMQNNPVDYSANNLNVNQLNMGGFQMDQRQQYYDLGSNPGYFQQTPHFGQGTYPNGL
ncbi:MAG: hypothetical protein SGILL_001009 [Bacillariaceae sp.]